VRVQIFCSEVSVGRLDEGIVGGFFGPGEVEGDAALISPQMQITRHELRALVDAGRSRNSFAGRLFPAPWAPRNVKRGSSAGENREKVSTIVSTRGFRPVASWSWTKSIAQASFDRVAGRRRPAERHSPAV
jgi:hypothetical protein